MGDYNYVIGLYNYTILYTYNYICSKIHVNYRFKSSPNGLIFCTDVAARGIDVKDIKYVIHFELPKTFEVSYL